MIRFNVGIDNSVPMAIDFEYHMIDNRRMTIAKLHDIETGAEFAGVCRQDSRDRDVKEKSRKIALKKVIDSLGLTKNIRKQIWNGYFNRSAKYNLYKNTV